MKTPDSLNRAFGPSPEFEKQISEFLFKNQLIEDASSLKSKRYLSRSIAPHIERLSKLFNRENEDQAEGLASYWKKGTRPEHLRLAYFLYFMPSNLFRIAAVWSELQRLGYRWKCGDLNAVEFGAGPATGACGIAAGEFYCSLGLPKKGTWALIEQDRSTLALGIEWATEYFQSLKWDQWRLREFVRKIDTKQGFLPPKAPKFNLWLMSFFLNEFSESRSELASILLEDWKNHLEENGLVILVEPALKQQSRKLLELRRELLRIAKERKYDWFQILLPCLGHQVCGALENTEDWCHEDVSWWRPPYFRILDDLVGLDRKSLPFSYLVITKSKSPRSELLPKIGESKTHRLVSPAHSEGQDLEFFTCSPLDGKRRARVRPQEGTAVTKEVGLQRGDILLDAEVRGDQNSSRIQTVKKTV